MEKHIEKIAHDRGYHVTEDGGLINPDGDIVKGYLVEGYRRTAIRVDGKDRALKFHRLAGFQMFGVRLFDTGMQVRHLDGDRSNNSQINLAIGTTSQNSMDRPVAQRKAHAVHAAKFPRKR